MISRDLAFSMLRNQLFGSPRPDCHLETLVTNTRDRVAVFRWSCNRVDCVSLLILYALFAEIDAPVLKARDFILSRHLEAHPLDTRFGRWKRPRAS